jgi:hypothetical protein
VAVAAQRCLSILKLRSVAKEVDVQLPLGGAVDGGRPVWRGLVACSKTIASIGSILHDGEPPVPRIGVARQSTMSSSRN